MALKKRLLIDERNVRKVSKKLLSSKYTEQKVLYIQVFFSNEGIAVDFEQLEFQFDKNLAILKSFERDWNQLTLLSQQIGKNDFFFFAFIFHFFIEDNISSENLTIKNCKNDLISAKNILQNRLEYDNIAMDILKLQSRPELLK